VRGIDVTFFCCIVTPSSTICQPGGILVDSTLLYLMLITLWLGLVAMLVMDSFFRAEDKKFDEY